MVNAARFTRTDGGVRLRLMCAGAATTLLAIADITDQDLIATLLSVALGGVGVYWTVRPLAQTPDTGLVRRSLAGSVAKIALLAGSIALSALAAEGLARWVYRDVTTTGDFRGYFTTRWLRREVRHNHYGYRGGEFNEVTPAGVYRVAVMGDSFTYGNGVPEDRRFSNVLDAALRTRGVEVLNFGFPGNNWPEHVTTLERRVLRLRPNFVLLQWGINDIERDQDVAKRPALPPLIPSRSLHEALYARSALYTLLNAQWTRLQVARQMGDTYANYMTRLYADPQSEGSLLAASFARRFVELCRERGVPVGIVMFPDAGVDLGADYPYVFLHERTLALCTEQGIPCVDLLPQYRLVENRQSLWASPLDSHPSALANQIAADAIMATWAARWSQH